MAIHLVGLVGYSLILRKSLLANIDRFLLATVMQTGIAVPILFAMLLNPLDPAVYTGKIITFIVAAILIVIAYHYANVNSLKHLEASVYSIFFNLRIIFTTVLGIVFLGEETVLLRILGGLLIFAAIFIVKQKGNKDITALGIKWGIAAALTLSFLQLFEKAIIQEIGYFAYAAPAYVLAAMLMWLVLLLRKQDIETNVFKSPGVYKLMVFRSLSAYGALLAFGAGTLLSVMNYLSSLSVIFIVIFGVILLKERDYVLRKSLATITAFLGLTLILLSNL